MKSYCNCPNCGQGIELHPVHAQQQQMRLPPGFKYEMIHDMENSIPVSAPNSGGVVEPPLGMKATKRTPTRAPSFEADVKVPFIKTLVSSTIAQALTWIIITGNLGFWNWVGFWFSWVLYIGLAWLAISRGIDSLMYIYEEIVNEPVKQPQQPVQPQQHEHIINLPDENGAIQRSRLPDGVEWELWLDFCYGVFYEGKTFGRNQWCRKPNKIMDETQWQSIMSYCENQNFTSGQGGERVLTRKGKRSFEAFADERTRVS